LTARIKWSPKEQVGGLKDLHNVSSEAHIAGMVPPAGLLPEQR
jgi:hypothetical protein